MKEIHTIVIEDYRKMCERNDIRNAENYGMTLEEYKERKKQFFINQIWKQIKKKTL